MHFRFLCYRTPKASAILDFGGGGTTLAKLIHEAPDLNSMMTTAGVAPVACYMIGLRVEDLASLDSLEQAGSQPQATLFV